MLNIGNKIDVLLKQNNISIIDFAKGIGVSRPGAYAIIKRKNIDTDLLQKIANFLHIPVVRFFDDKISLFNSHTEIPVGYDELEAMENLVQLNALKGKGCVFIQYDLIENKFITHFMDLKKPIKPEQINEWDNPINRYIDDEGNLHLDRMSIDK